ncbi:MAG TPA: hypothetical protein VM557_11995, partial [Thermoanaerobaculia bacterium]|nr:hypothetical protein [Thermoanaerobaculia bacterium]
AASRCALTLAVFLLAGTAALDYPIDGDEAYYVLIAESLLLDRDADLANQYRNLEESVIGRMDLKPQPGDRRSAEGEERSRLEPFLSLLLVPGIAVAGLWGAMATIAIFGAFASCSIFQLLVESGVSRRIADRVWPLIAFGPPLLFYSMRIWPEAPAALCFSEAIRCAGKRRFGRMGLWLAALSLLKLRFVVIAIPFAVIVLWKEWKGRRGARVTTLAAGTLVAFVLAAIAIGGPSALGRLGELAPRPLSGYLSGFFGLLLDAQAGLLFQAPLWFAGLLALIGSRRMRGAIAWAAAASIPYLILLIPRSEWHGGWSPPLRYLVVFAPLFAFAAARAFEEFRSWRVPLALGTIAVAIHGVAFPWRLFQIANGEAVMGERLSSIFGSDFSRLLPSAIRLNGAMILAAIVLGVIVIWRLVRRRAAWRVSFRERGAIVAMSLALVISMAVAIGMRPGSVVHLEDAHVRHEGGDLAPHIWTVARFLHTGGWTLEAGESVRFRMRPGAAVIYASSGPGAEVEIGTRRVSIPAGDGTASPVIIDDSDVRIRVVAGSVTLDRIEHE